MKTIHYKNNIKLIIHADGDKYWYKDGKHHRINGYAIIHNNDKEYWYNDKKYYKTKDYWKLMYRKGHIDKVTYMLKLISE